LSFFRFLSFSSLGKPSRHTPGQSSIDGMSICSLDGLWVGWPWWMRKPVLST